jgi:predicted alpha/beta-fold hydrolase
VVASTAAAEIVESAFVVLTSVLGLEATGATAKRMCNRMVLPRLIELARRQKKLSPKSGRVVHGSALDVAEKLRPFIVCDLRMTLHPFGFGDPKKSYVAASSVHRS